MALLIPFDADDPQQNGLLYSFDSEGTYTARELVRGDENLALILRPVIANDQPGRPWQDDTVNGDSFKVSIGKIDTPPTGGTWNLASGATTWNNLAVAIPAETLDTTIGSGYEGSGVSVLLLSQGVYQITRDNVGVAGPLTSSGNTLTPPSVVSIITAVEGDSTTREVVIVSLRQLPVAYSEPDTALPVSSVSATVKQAGSGTTNKVYEVSFGAPGTYAGSYSVQYTPVSGSAATAGVFTPDTSEEEWTAALEALTSVGDFGVSISNGKVTVEMRGTQKLSNTPVIAVTNINLVAPKGVSGVIQLNTINLYRAFYETTATQLTFTFEIRRDRADGESRTVFQYPITLKRNLIDPLTMVSLLLLEGYPDADDLVTKDGYYYRFKDDGHFQLLNADTGLYHTLTIVGSIGEEAIVIAAGEA